jgi:hypothetical protein
VSEGLENWKGAVAVYFQSLRFASMKRMMMLMCLCVHLLLHLSCWFPFVDVVLYNL